MVRLGKDAPATWWGGGAIPPSDLDHVVAAKHLEFTSFGNFAVTVKGWPKEGGMAKQKNWIDSFSDHGLLYFEVLRPDNG